MVRSLTSRERVTRMFSRRDHDRVPRHESFWDETITRWQQEGMVGDRLSLFDRFHTDFDWVAGAHFSPFPGRREVVAEDAQTRVTVDDWGATTRYHKHHSTAPEHLGHECNSRPIWDARFKPLIRAAAPSISRESLAAGAARATERQSFRIIAFLETFEMMRALVGDEVAMYAMGDDPEWVADISRTLTDAVLRNLNALVDAGVQADGVFVGGDMAYNHGTLCSPSMYRELVWPDHKRLVDFCHAHDWRWIYHSDGDVNAVIPLYIDAGFDCLNPLEAKAGMDVRTLVPKYGSKLAFFGNIDQSICGTNDLARIEAEVRAKLAAGKSGKCYVYHSDHSTPPTLSWATFQFMMDLVERHGNYA